MKKILSLILFVSFIFIFASCDNDDERFSMRYYTTMEKVDLIIELNENDIYRDINGEIVEVASFKVDRQRDLYPKGTIIEYYIKHQEGDIEHIIEEIEYHPTFIYVFFNPTTYILSQTIYDENGDFSHILYDEVGDVFLRNF